MNRTFALILGIVLLTCVGSEVWAQCAGGSCGASAMSSSGGGGFLSRLFGGGRKSNFSMSMSPSYSSSSMMSYNSPMSFSAPRAMSSFQSSYNAPMSFSAPMMASSCYSSSVASAPQVYSVPMVMVPQSQTFSTPQLQVTPTPQTQSAPPLPLKTTPSQEFAPSRSSQGKVVRIPETKRAIMRTPPSRQKGEEVLERVPTARLGCLGPCCGGERECECGEDGGKCKCESPPGVNKPAPKKGRQLFAQVYDQMGGPVDYSGMTNMNTPLVVDYSGFSNKANGAPTASRWKVAISTTR
jgi:hypothetical protein